MTDNHPITIPAGSITSWKTIYRETYQGDFSEAEFIATQAARWGADQELEASVVWLKAEAMTKMWNTVAELASELHAYRRPKPPSLKEQALAELELLKGDANSHGLGFDAPAIRRALEALPE